MGDFLRLLREGKFTTKKSEKQVRRSSSLNRANVIIDELNSINSTKKDFQSFFKDGKIYKRQSIHDEWGGARWSGISVPCKYGAIFLFTNKDHHTYRSSGYEDGWEGDKFYYSGCGKLGDQQWNHSNLELRDHVVNGKDVLLFESAGDGYVKLVGRMQLLEYYKKPFQDTSGKERKIIQFVLQRKPTEDKNSNSSKKRNIEDNSNTNSEKRQKIISDISEDSLSESESISVTQKKSQSQRISLSSSVVKTKASQTPKQNETQIESLSDDDLNLLTQIESINEMDMEVISPHTKKQSQLVDNMRSTRKLYTQPDEIVNFTQNETINPKRLLSTQSQKNVDNMTSTRKLYTQPDEIVNFTQNETINSRGFLSSQIQKNVDNMLSRRKLYSQPDQNATQNNTINSQGFTQDSEDNLSISIELTQSTQPTQLKQTTTTTKTAIPKSRLQSNK